jgi:DNA-binding MarR family transcriptional regulator
LDLGSRAFAHFGAVATELGLPPPVAMAVRRIEPARPGPMNELAEAMGCDPSFVTWIADQLEERGLAERQLSSHDRRVKVLALTPAGLALRDELRQRLARVPFALDRLSVDEASTLSELLARILSDADAPTGPECRGPLVGQEAVGTPRAKRPVVAKG